MSAAAQDAQDAQDANGAGLSVFDPPETLLARFGLTLSESGETVLWLGAPGRLALLICGMPRQGLYVAAYALILIAMAIYTLLTGDFTPRHVRFLMLFPFLEFLALFVLSLSWQAAHFVYAVTSHRLVIKLRDDSRLTWWARFLTRRFRRLAGPDAMVSYPYAEVRTVNVRRWFFDIGNLDFKDFARPESGAPARPQASGAPRRVVERFTLFPGANYGANAYSPSASMAAGFYGIRRVREVGALIERQGKAIP